MYQRISGVIGITINMKKLFFIGTLHAGITPNKELAQILKTLKPDQLLVEIHQKDVVNNYLKNYPVEMVFALRWAKRNKIQVKGFAHHIDMLAKGKTQKDNLVVIQEQKKVIKKYFWHDFNKEKYTKLLNTKNFKPLIDQKAWKQCEEAMARNIKKYQSKKGVSVVLCGVGHLSFFEKKFKQAIFPLR